MKVRLHLELGKFNYDNIKYVIIIYMTSTQLFPIVNPVANTVNEVVEGVATYEALRLQFLITAENGFTERDIARTIKCFLTSNLASADKVLSYDGTQFVMETNNGDTPWQKLVRIYKQQDNFVNNVVNVMIGNIDDVFNSLPNTEQNLESRNRLVYRKAKLSDLKEYYLQHTKTLELIEIVKYLL